ncbi:MAG: acetamidase/formamidase family protein [Gammaproteobacteria bacterium]|nr:acetamidase/formamidase family protein [Gammaproteobacteria bacterium]
MRTIKRRKVQKYAFDNRDKPCLRVKPGETFRVETDDALSGMIADDSDHPKVMGFEGKHFASLAKATPGLFNPVVGPIYVDGCKAGDVLAVHIDWIDPWRYGFSGIIPGMGPLGDSLRYKDCTDGYVHVIEHLPGPSGHTRDGWGKYSDSLTWKLEPFIGTLATAPEREVFTSVLGQGPFGGNIDCRDIRAGHTVYLNSYNDGGLLYIGDCHGGQGDTEFTGIADETRATVQLSCTVVKNKRLPCVRIEKPDSIVAVGINRPLEHAVYDATANLMQWLEEDYGVPPRDLYVRMSCDPEFRIRVYQMVRISTIEHVAGAEYPKERLFNAYKSSRARATQKTPAKKVAKKASAKKKPARKA